MPLGPFDLRVLACHVGKYMACLLLSTPLRRLLGAYGVGVWFRGATVTPNNFAISTRY